MFRRTFNVQVSQNVISIGFWATLNMRKYEPIIFQIPFTPPPQKKNVFFANVLASTIFYNISEHFAFDKATWLSIPIYFHF